MGDLIWIGNILLPREAVFIAVGIVAVIVIAAFTWLTAEQEH